MNHKSHSGNTISTSNTDTPFGLVIQFPYKKDPLVNLSREHVVASSLFVLSLRPVPPSHPLVVLAGSCVASQHATLLSSCHLIISLCHLSLSCCASWLSHHHLLSSSHCTVLSSSHCAGWLLCCLSLRRHF